jgi:hypothetical protein
MSGTGAATMTLCPCKPSVISTTATVELPPIVWTVFDLK